MFNIYIFKIAQIAIYYSRTKSSLISASAVIQELTDLAEIREILEIQGCLSIPESLKLIVRLMYFLSRAQLIYKSVNFNVYLINL